MHPDFISIGPFSIHSYGVMMALGFLAGLGNWILLGRRSGRSINFCTDLMFWVMVSGILGARIAYVLENWQEYGADPLSIIRVDQGGLIFYGGFVAAAAVIVWFSRQRRVALVPLLDFVVTSVPLSHAFGRIGCFLNGCCFGRLAPQDCCGVEFPKTSIPWYSQVHDGRIGTDAAASLPVYPVQLYEAFFNVLVYGILITLFRRRLRPGVVTATYLCLYAAGRFTLEFWRGDRGERLAVGVFSIGQFVSLLVMAAGLIMLGLLRWSRSTGNNNA